jgi:hypothetical protein
VGLGVRGAGLLGHACQGTPSRRSTRIPADRLRPCPGPDARASPSRSS